jgi:HTH-type transcriptional regulator/antitoxin HigA
MANLSSIHPAQVFPPGYFIKDQLEQRQWSQNELAEVLGITPRHLSQVMNGESPLSYDLAIQLGQAFDTSPQLWSNLYLSYALWQEQQEAEVSETEVKAGIYERMPIRDMIKKGWLREPRNVRDLAKQVAGFWGRDDADLAFIDTEYTPCLNRSSLAKANQFNKSYALTWYRMASVCAQDIQVPAYRKPELQQLFASISGYTAKSDGVPSFLSQLNQCGVKFIVLPHLEKTYLDGAAFIQEENPVLVYTARYNRVDNFWFTIAHEIAHVLLHLSKSGDVILDDLDERENTDLEQEANAAAAEQLKHKEIGACFKCSGQVHPKRVLACARMYNLHPSIVAGKLAREGAIGYRLIQRFNEEVVKVIPKKFVF